MDRARSPRPQLELFGARDIALEIHQQLCSDGTIEDRDVELVVQLERAVVEVGRPEDAEDAVQEAFIDAFKAIGTFDISRRFYQWFYFLLRNRCYKTTAKRRPTESLDDVQLLAPQSGTVEDTRLALEKALRSLSREEREIVSLKYFSGLSYDELATHLQIPRGTVMSRLFYARQRLQGKLKEV